MRFTGDAPSAVSPAGPAAMPFASVLLRSARMSAVAFLVLMGTLAAKPVDVAASLPHAHSTAVWKDSYSRRFPGCVSLVLWPAGQQPVAYVTRTSAGALNRVSADLGARA